VRTKLEAVTVFCLVYSVKMMVYSNSTARLYTSSDKEESSGATFNSVDEVELKLKQDYSKKFINID
jgi:hypothetical protein